MLGSNTDYDRGVNTFSPEGRLFQIEYATKAVELGSTGIAAVTNDGIVMVSEKKISSPLLEPDSIRKMEPVDVHLGCLMSGSTADGTALLNRVRNAAALHRYLHKEPMPLKFFVDAIAERCLNFSENMADSKGLARPYGVAFLIGGHDGNTYQLYAVDPAGTTIKYDAAAVGAGHQNAEDALVQKYTRDMTLEDATAMLLLILRSVAEDKLTADNVQIGQVQDQDRKFTLVSRDTIQTLLDQLPPVET